MKKTYEFIQHAIRNSSSCWLPSQCKLESWTI